MQLLRACACLLFIAASSTAFAGDDEATCGREMAGDADVPDKLGRLFAHVAAQMHRHAAWVGAATVAARREHDGLEHVAAEYQAIADAAGRAAIAMRAMRELPPTAHDPSRLDRAATAKWMREKIALQRDFAKLLERHAADSESALRELER